MSVVELLIVVLLLSPVFIWAGKQGRMLIENTNRAWRDAAEELGGSFVPGEPRRIVATVEGIDVQIDHYRTIAAEKETAIVTRVRAAARAPTSFQLSVTRAHALSGVARFLGMEDVRIGDPAFDGDYIVKTNDPTSAKLWLNRSVRRKIHLAQHYAFAIADGLVSAETAHLETDANDMINAARAVAALADGRGRLLRAWREIARKYKGSVRAQKRRWATLELELDDVGVTIDTATHGSNHFTFARARVVGAALASFVLTRDKGAEGVAIDDLPDYRLHCLNRDAALAHLDERARAAIAELAPSEVRSDEGELVVEWPGICIDPRALEKAASLAAMLAARSARGPYR